MIRLYQWQCPHCGNLMMTYLSETDDDLLRCRHCGLRVYYKRLSRRRRRIEYDE